MSETYRVLVTGSRTWDDGRTVWDALEDLQWSPRTLVVVHGAAPKGADEMADRWARVHGVGGGIVAEPHAADWDRYGKRAGFIRNAEMVSLGAELCLAFIAPCTNSSCRNGKPHGSHGATHCAALAEKAGIEVRRFTVETADV